MASLDLVERDRESACPVRSDVLREAGPVTDTSGVYSGITHPPKGSFHSLRCLGRDAKCSDVKAPRAPAV